MGVFLSHLDMQPIFYGIIIILGLVVITVDIVRMKLMAAILGIGIFVLVFWMHGGTMTGGMSAAVAGLIGSMILPPIISYFLNRKD
jgi:hypothetical protein